MVAILGQDRSLVFGPFRFGAFEYLLCDLVLLSIFVIYFVIYQCVCDHYVDVFLVEFGDFYLHFGSY